jgi:hypothetical protein
MTQVAKANGFQNLSNQRAGMHQWSLLNALRQHGSNREAEAIVQSFQKQIDSEQDLVLLKAA